MGSDGAAGAAAIRDAGGVVLAEDESTCVVWGMPRAVTERGVAHRVVPLDEVAPTIVQCLRSGVCHPERSEGSHGRRLEIPRLASSPQDDTRTKVHP
jgi:hypothetical protein